MLDTLPAQPALDPTEEHVRLILESRRRNNASGQDAEDVENIRAAYTAGVATDGGQR